MMAHYRIRGFFDMHRRPISFVPIFVIARLSLVTAIVSTAYFNLGPVAPAGAATPSTTPSPGLRDGAAATHALMNARIVTAPGKVIEQGNLILRDGVIVAVGPAAVVPDDARVWHLDGQTIYPGLIDAYGELSAEASKLGVSERHGAGYWNSHVVPQVDADPRYSPDAGVNKKLRGQGIIARLVAPSAGIIKGTSALVATGDDPGSRSILRGRVALHLMLTPAQRQLDVYPMSPMGAMALVRQALYDARWYADACQTYAAEPGLSRPERNDALLALQPYLSGKSPVMVQTADELYLLRAKQLADEFGLQVIVRGSGREYRRLDAVKATGLAVVLPLNFPKPPRVTTPEAASSVSLDRLLHWDMAPENPARLDAAGVKIAFTSSGLADSGTFLSAVRKAVERGLPKDAALRALTTTPAELYGVSDRLGALEPGKAASFIVADGDLFDPKTTLAETWVEGRRHEVDTATPADLRGTWQLQLTKPDGGTESLNLVLEGKPRKLSGKLRRGDKESSLTRLSFEAWHFNASLKAEPLGWPGIVQLSATVSPAASVIDASRPAAESWLGSLTWSDGSKSPLRATRLADAAAADPKPADAASPAPDESKDEVTKADAGKNAEGDSKSALYPVNYPLGAFGCEKQPDQPAALVFEHATIWTSGPAGTLEDATLVIEQGKITAVGRDVKVPGGAIVVDLRGKHISPGIIDCHSHVATDGGINEQAQTITAEVRVGDFIDFDDVQIYRQLAGGVTTANILHGSANAVGGQNQVIKFRWGALADELKFVDAPPGIKFALGENVKQSNWGDRFKTRYPQTRMGVEQLIRDAFRAAQDYRRQWQVWREKPAGLPPRIDLELEPLVEVLEGKRLVHCHSYRQDEIFAFLRACEDFGVKVATLQHILEGYKLADVIAKHGAGASSFSDWWAYKFEVYDAIPYNGALLHQAGVCVSFNSDDPELARRLNLEAAKAVRYGGIEPAEALKFVTLNPARQLRIDEHVGSLEPGKDADVVVWSASPLSSYACCEQTWIDGRKYFDRADDLRRRGETAKRRAALIQRVLVSGEETEGLDDEKRDLYPREDIFCAHGDDHR